MLSLIMLVVIDTNVLYQALRSTKGASNYILKLIRNRHVNIAISIPVFNEYEEVLKRKKTLQDLSLSIRDVDKVLRFIAYIGRPFNTYFLLRPNLQDENDNIFVELTITSNSQFIITSNIRDFKNAELKSDDLNIITPSDFVKYWRDNYEEKS